MLHLHLVSLQRRKSPLILSDFTKLSHTLTITNSITYTNTHTFSYSRVPRHSMPVLLRKLVLTHIHTITLSMKPLGVRSRSGAMRPRGLQMCLSKLAKEKKNSDAQDLIWDLQNQNLWRWDSRICAVVGSPSESTAGAEQTSTWKAWTPAHSGVTEVPEDTRKKKKKISGQTSLEKLDTISTTTFS